MLRAWNNCGRAATHWLGCKRSRVELAGVKFGTLSSSTIKQITCPDSVTGWFSSLKKPSSYSLYRGRLGSISGSLIKSSLTVTKWVYSGLTLIPVYFTLSGLYYYVGDYPIQVARAHWFFACAGFTCLPMSLVFLASLPFVYLLDWKERRFFDILQRNWAKWNIKPFFTPEFIGLDKVEKVLSENKSVIYVANHKSFADIYALLASPVPVRFLSKREIFYIPVCGWSMWLLGHVGVQRGCKKSGGAVQEVCMKRLADGMSIVFFAEGSRSHDERIKPFKRGAFALSKESGAPIVPISISGTGKLMPPFRDQKWLEDGGDAPVRVVFHDPIYPSDYSSSHELLEETRRVVEAGIVCY